MDRPENTRTAMNRCRRGVLFFLVATLGGALGQTPNFVPMAELSNLSPLGGQRGTTVEVTVTGQHLDHADALLFANPAITSELKKDVPYSASSAVFLVKLPGDAKSGLCDVRVHGKFGLSNPRMFCVGRLKEVMLASAPSSQANAAMIEANSVVNSTTSAGARAWFKFHAAAGSKSSVLVESPDTRFEPQMSITDSQGRVLKTGGIGEVLEHVAPTEGDFFIELHDLLYRGGADHRFRLSVASEPPELQRTRRMSSAFTDDAAITRIDSKAAKHRDDVTPHDMALSLPGEHIGLFPAGGKAAAFIINAKKGDVWWLEVLSHRLGHATAPALVVERVENDKATFMAEAATTDPTTNAAGFNLEIRDVALRFEVKNDGAYRVKLRDLFNTAPSSPRLPFALFMRKEKPDFALVAVPDQPPRQRPPTSAYLLPPTLRRGGVASARVFVRRQDGFAGEIQLKAEGLPQGVTSPGAVLGNGEDSTSLTFVAEEKAQPWSGLIRIVGTAKINDQEVSHEARAGSLVWTVNDTRFDSFQCRLTNGFALAVVADDAPISVEMKEDKIIEAGAADKIKIECKVTRRNYTEPVKVRAFTIGDAEKVAAVQLDIPAKADSASFELNLASLGVKPGEHTIVIAGAADRVKYKKNADEVPAAEADVKRLGDDLAKAEAEAKSATGDAVKGAQEKLKACQKAKTDAEKRAKDMAKLAEPKDMTFPLWSKPIRIRVK